MSEIELLYKNAGIEKIKLAYPDNFEPFYPDFTPEKQLELIKWLLNNKNIGILKFEVINGKYEVYDTYYEFDKYRESLDEALADYICCLWQDLTEQERTEIADILRG